MNNKILFVSEVELVNMVAENFGVQASANVIEVEVDGEEITKDVIQMYVEEDKVQEILSLISSALNITEKEIIVSKDKQGRTVLSVDYFDLTTLLAEKYEVELTSNYEACECDLFSGTVIAYEIR